MSEKTEEATPKRKRKARMDGDVAKSGEFSGVMVMFAAFGTLLASSTMIFTRLLDFMRHTITLVSRESIGPEVVERFMLDGLLTLAECIGPMLGVAFVAAAFFTYIQIGALFTMKPLIPDANRLNMANNAKNLVNKDKLVELVKNLLKLSLMGVIGVSILADEIPRLATTPRGRLVHGLTALGDSALRLSVTMLSALLLFGVADLLWQRHRHNKKLMMGKDEVQREYKESEGDPMLKGKRQQLHHELINDPGVQRVKDADAVVVNPTHVAVALRYREHEGGAPRIIAAGRGEVAAQIRRLARKHNVPIVRDVPLARALVEVGVEVEIPEQFYESVAVILRQVYALARTN